MPGTRGLTEARAGDGANTGGLEELMAVEDVRKLLLGLGSIDGLGREVNGGEGIHGTVGGVAGDARERVEGGDDELGAALERVVDIVALGNELIEGLISGLGRIDHERDHELAEDVGAKIDGAELVVLVHDFLSDTVHLDITATLTAFTEIALRNRVEGEELERGIVGTHLVFDLLEGVEGLQILLVDILLIHLIGQQNNTPLVTESNNLLHIILRQDLAGGIARIDDDEGARNAALRDRRLETSLQLLIRQRPSFRLVQIIRQLRSSQQCDRRRVEGILRDGNHDSINRTSNQQLQRSRHRRRRSITQKDMLRQTVSRSSTLFSSSIASHDKLRNILSNNIQSSAAAVRASSSSNIRSHKLSTTARIRSHMITRVRNRSRILDQ